MMKQKLIEMLCRISFQYSDSPVFKLASGRKSRFYINCRPAILSPDGMFLSGHLVFDCIKGLNLSGVGGLTFGADPMAIATAFVSELKTGPVKAFSIKKEKEGPDAGWIEGDIKPGCSVAIIDDVATTGGSTVKAIHRARLEGLHVQKAVILVDREEGGMENIRAHVPDAEAVIKKFELMEHLDREKSNSRPG